MKNRDIIMSKSFKHKLYIGGTETFCFLCGSPTTTRGYFLNNKEIIAKKIKEMNINDKNNELLGCLNFPEELLNEAMYKNIKLSD